MSTAFATLTADARAACRVQLATVAGLPAQAQWSLEGEPFTPTAGTAWLRESLTPAAPRTLTVGPQRLVTHTLLYRVALFQPRVLAGNATPVTSRLDAQADAVLAAFEPGATFDAPSGRTVTVRSARRAGLVEEPDWMQAPVLVTVTADAITTT